MNIKIELLNRARLFWRTMSVAFVCALFFCEAQADVGGDSPDGVAGQFSGVITTGSSYSAYTGNMIRSITDMVVADSMGAYPLALTRTYNSRGSLGFAFGNPSAWQHSYEWGVGSGISTVYPVPPTGYAVVFPDGRSETFTQQGSEWKAAAGTSERFIPFIGTPNTATCYLVLPDGGKVEFLATLVSQPGPPTAYWYSYQVQSITDPYGLQTVFTYDPNTHLLSRVTEPGGKYLQFSYSNGTIAGVTSSAGRTVTYGYQTFAYTRQLVSASYDGLPQFTAHYNYKVIGNVPWLWTADEPRYPGPMKRIAYVYKTGTNADGSPAAPGQILSELYWDGRSGDENLGPAVSTLEVGTGGNYLVRKETRADGKTRIFTYIAGGYLTNVVDFKGHGSSQVHDPTTKFVTSFTDANGHTTDFTRDALGHVLQTTFPASSAVTPTPAPRGTTVVAYEANGYYVHFVQDEAGHVTTSLRDSNHRVTEIDYGNTNGDDGRETFVYNSLGQITSHRLRTGGTETFSYDSLHRLWYYSDPYHSNPDNPNINYLYDSWGRVTEVVDAQGTPTHFIYDDVNNTITTQFITDPIDGQVHTIVQTFNPDGTLQQVTDQLGHVTSYTYDDYRRVKTVTPPIRGFGDNNPHTASFYYGANSAGSDINDYQYTDANVTYVVSPSGKKTKGVYDENRRPLSSIVGFGSNPDESATTSVSYDNAGNVVGMTDPKLQPSSASYDERNRLMEVLDRNLQPTEIRYDQQGRRKQITRANGQTVTFDLFDIGNRVTQKTITQTPEPSAVTQYTYYDANSNHPVGLLQSMKDPRQVATSSSESYGFTYDSMGRKLTATYPRVNASPSPTESWHYDTMGRVDQFTNRAGKHLVPTYDILNRLRQMTWDDGITPAVSYLYDGASRLTSISNSNSVITRAYYNDNLLQSEMQAIAGLPSSETINYAYDADSNRKSIIYPDSFTFNYEYTGRNQLLNIWVGANPEVSYTYDVNSNIHVRTLPGVRTSSFAYDGLDRVINITHSLNGTTRTLDYDYDVVGNRKWTKRDGGNGDVFGYDLADQVNAVKLDVQNPSATPSPLGTPSITYDAGGNRATFSAYGTTDNYSTNDLNQYTLRNLSPATYDTKGNMTAGLDASGYTFDAQNRVLSASKNGATTSFTYDGLGRQVTRTIGSGLMATTTYNIYDGWNLIEERLSNGVLGAEYVYGADGLFESWVSSRTASPWVFHFHNGEGSVSHVTDLSGNLLEAYRYDLQGTPVFLDAGGKPLSGSKLSIRHLFTGEQWYSELGLYDLRNRFYSPDSGRFIQPDPIGFGGGNNMYRHCGNSPVNAADPFGLVDERTPKKLKYDVIAGADIRNWDGTFAGPDTNGGTYYAPDHAFDSLSQANQRASDASYGVEFYGPGSGLFGGNGYAGAQPGRNDASGATVSGGSGPNVPRGIETRAPFGWRPGTSTASFWKRWWATGPTPEQKAWTDKGKWPTLILTGSVFGPLALPETAGPWLMSHGVAAWTASQAATHEAAIQVAATGYAAYITINTHPEAIQATIDFTTEFSLGVFKIEGGAPDSVAGLYGVGASYIVAGDSDQ
jgi:RHS repeat-associated protein